MLACESPAWVPVVAMVERNNRLSWICSMFLIARGRDVQPMESMRAVLEELNS